MEKDTKNHNLRFPKKGMKYEDVRTRVKRIASYDTENKKQQQNMINSLIGQAVTNQDEGARAALGAELNSVSKHYKMSANSPLPARTGRGKENTPGVFGSGYELSCPNCPSKVFKYEKTWLCADCKSAAVQNKKTK